MISLSLLRWTVINIACRYPMQACETCHHNFIPMYFLISILTIGGKFASFCLILFNIIHDISNEYRILVRIWKPSHSGRLEIIVHHHATHSPRVNTTVIYFVTPRPFVNSIVIRYVTPIPNVLLVLLAYCWRPSLRIYPKREQCDPSCHTVVCILFVIHHDFASGSVNI